MRAIPARRSEGIARREGAFIESLPT
jgi:hypothetical protein